VRGLFVTGTDTGVGKTVLSGCLLAAMRAEGENALPAKPVLTGLDAPAEHASAGGSGGAVGPPSTPWPADDELLAGIAGVDRHQVAPLRFGPPVSPHLAAELAGEAIDPDALVGATREAVAGASVAVVEGVGGLMVPLSGRWLVRDLAAALGLPLVVAARPGLGTISHTLLTLEAARAAGLTVSAVVLMPWPAEPDAIERSNRETIASLGGVEVATLPLLAGPDPAEMARAGAALPWRRWLEPGA
jgi:dethiobiotin synthetase